MKSLFLALVMLAGANAAQARHMQVEITCCISPCPGGDYPL